MRLSEKARFRLELAMTGALVAFGMGTALYAFGVYLLRAWQWLSS